MHWCFSFILAVTLPAAADQSPKTSPSKATGLQGAWVVVSMQYQGKGVPGEFFKNNKLVIGPTKIVTRKGGQVVSEATYKIYPARKPAMIEMKPIKGPKKGRTIAGIYLLEGDNLKICAPDVSGKAPKEFATAADADLILMGLRREKS
jgi:uncharacterized protein (TIGR03067 family)